MTGYRGIITTRKEATTVGYIILIGIIAMTAHVTIHADLYKWILYPLAIIAGIIAGFYDACGARDSIRKKMR